MSFEEFFAYIRANIDTRHTEEYWRTEYEHLKDKSKKAIMKEMPFLAVRATAKVYHATNR